MHSRRTRSSPSSSPHLTIGDHGTVEEFRAAERDVETHLPISPAARAVTLMVEQPDNRWERFASFPLNQRLP